MLLFNDHYILPLKLFMVYKITYPYYRYALIGRRLGKRKV
jgi:hypothetical protein